MKKIVFILAITASAVCANAQQFSNLQPATGIDSAFCYFDSTGAHLRAELNTEEMEVIEAAARRIVEEFNTNVAALWHQWTPEEKEEFTPREREEYKNRIEKATRELFIADADFYFTHETSNYKVYKKNDGFYYYQNQNHKEHRAYNPQDDGSGTLREIVEEDIKHEPARIEITNKYKKSSTLKPVRQYLNNIKNVHTYQKVVFNAGGITVSNRVTRDAEGRYVGTICYYQDFAGYRPDGGSYIDRTFRCVTFYVYIDVQPGLDDKDLVVWHIKLGDIRATATE